MRLKKFLLSLLSLVSSVVVLAQLPISINIQQTPLSYRGAYMVLAVSEDTPGDQKLFLRDLSGNKMWASNDIFLLQPLNKDGRTETATITATSSKALITSASGKIELCFQDADIIRIKGNGVGLKMTQIAKDNSNLIMPVKPGQWRVQQGGNAHYVFTTLRLKLSFFPPGI